MTLSLVYVIYSLDENEMIESNVKKEALSSEWLCGKHIILKRKFENLLAGSIMISDVAKCQPKQQSKLNYISWIS